MASFTVDPFLTPFGKRVYLRSTQDIKTFSATVAHETVPFKTIDGYAQRVLQSGTVLAKITSGPDTGKVGPFQAAGTAEVTTLTTTGTATGGTFTITALGATTAPIAYNATAAVIAAAVNAALDAINVDAYVIGAGGPQNTTPTTLTWGESEGDIPQPTVNGAALTGAGHTITPTTTTAGVAGSTDGRGVLANIVGICDTFLPAQLRHRDVTVAVVYEASVVQANCIELNAAGAEIALTDTTAAQMFGKKSLDIKFF